jgi:hypothetical protein
MPTWVGTISTDWGTGGNWDTLSAPAVGTDAIFTGNPIRPCTTGATVRQCRDLITTGFTGVNAVLTIGSTTVGVINVNRNATFGTDTSHLDAASLANINMAVSGNTITSASSSVIVPGITNVSNGTVNLTGTISVKRFAPVVGTYNSAVAGTFIELVNGGTWSGSGGPGTNVTLRINGLCSNNSVTTKGTIVLAAGSTLTMNGGIDFNNAIGSINFSAGTLVHNTQNFTVQNSSAVTINLGTNSLYNATLNSSIILGSNMNIINNLVILTVFLSGAFDITVNGNLTGGNVTQNTAGRKIKVTGITTGTCTITSFSFFSNAYKLEIDCNANNFVMTGASITNNVVIDYLATNSGAFTATGSSLNFTTGALTMSMIGRGNTYVWGTIQNTGGLGNTLTLLSDVYVNAIGTTSNAASINGIGYTLNVFGNVGPLVAISGTATLKFIGASNATWTQTAATTNALKITFAKTSPAAVIIPNSFIYTGSLMKWDSGAVTHSGTLTLGTAVTMDTTSAVSWNNITIQASATTTINSELLITNSLTLLGTTTFAGTSGWTTGNFTHAGAGFTCTLRAGNTYRVNGLFTMIGTALSRARLQSNDFADVTVSIPASSNTMTVTAGTILAPEAGYVLGSRAFTNALPPALSNIIPDRPTIVSLISPGVYLLANPIGTTALTSYALGQVGKKAFFIVTNGTGSTNVFYAETRDIDSGGGGITILAGQSFADNTATPNLFRTLNWGPLIAPSGSVYYTFIN